MPLFGRNHSHSRHLSSPNAAASITAAEASESKIEPPSTPRVSRARARTLLSAPRTPLSKFFTSFGGRGGDSWGKNSRLAEDEDNGSSSTNPIIRPSTASSAYSSSSDSSFESMLTNATDCTVPDHNESSDGPKLGPAFCESSSPVASCGTSSALSTTHKKRKHDQDTSSTAIRDFEWTEEMDAHLWKTYMYYQNDPTVTPFYVVPGGVPPLGVCARVARVAKSTWKGPKHESKLPVAGGVRGRARAPVIPLKSQSRQHLAVNKAELMRRASSIKWPASESATRKRLRILCRRGYGPTKNPYHNHRQDPTQFRPRNRFADTVMADHPSSGPLPTIADHELNERPLGNALLTSTRSMALSLATSTSVSMRPDSALAALTGDLNTAPVSTIYHASHQTEDELDEPEILPSYRNDSPSPEFRGFTDANGNAPPVAEVLASVGIGLSSASSSREQVPRLRLPARRARANTIASHGPGIEPPVALSPLQIGAVASPYGTWPRRRRRPEGAFDEDDLDTNADPIEEFGGPLPPPPPSVPRGEPVDGVFDETSIEPRTPPNRGRARGYTVNVPGPTNNGRRRSRPSPVSTSLPSWAYEMPEGAPQRPNLAQLLGAQPLSAGLPRLGSPFKEDNSSKGKWRADRKDEEFGPPLPNKGNFLMGVASSSDSRDDAASEGESRPIKRIRE